MSQYQCLLVNLFIHFILCVLLTIQSNYKILKLKQKPKVMKQSKTIRPTATSNHSSLNNSKQVTIEIIQPQKKVREIIKVDKSPNSATVSVKDKETQISEKDRDLFMFDQEVTI